MKKLLILSLAALTLAACSSDSEEESANTSSYQYTAEEVMQIKSLQEEYGVNFTFPTESGEKLPSTEEMEQLCQMLAKMQSAKCSSVKGDTVVFSSRSKMARTKGRGVETYNGSYTGKGYLSIDNRSNDQSDEFEYTVSWSNLCAGSGQATGHVLTWPTGGYWHFENERFSYKVTGSWHLDYEFSFDAYYHTSRYAYNASLTGSISME